MRSVFKAFFVAVPLLLSLPAFAENNTTDQDAVAGVVALAPLCYWQCDGYDEPVALYYEPREEHIPANFVLHDDVKNWPEFEEYNYEEAGALVYDRKDGWYKIRRNNEYLWVEARDAGPFYAYPDILRDRLTYISNPDIKLSDAPGETGQRIDHPYHGTTEAAYIPVEVHAIRMVGNVPWVKVDVLQESPCYNNEAAVIRQGWVPAYDDNTKQRNLWFFSRGC